MASNIFGALAQAIPGIQGQALQGANEGGQVAWERARSTRKLDLEEQARKDALQQSMAELNARLEETKANRLATTQYRTESTGELVRHHHALEAAATAGLGVREKPWVTQGFADTPQGINQWHSWSKPTPDREPSAPIQVQSTDETGKPITLLLDRQGNEIKRVGGKVQGTDLNARYDQVLRNNVNEAKAALQTLDQDAGEGFTPGSIAQYAQTSKAHLLGMDLGAAGRSAQPDRTKRHFAAVRLLARLKASASPRGGTQGLIDAETENLIRDPTQKSAAMEDVRTALDRLGGGGALAPVTPTPTSKRGAVLQDLNALRGSGFDQR